MNHLKIIEALPVKENRSESAAMRREKKIALKVPQ